MLVHEKVSSPKVQLRGSLPVIFREQLRLKVLKGIKEVKI
jgi:hypothetical protein